MIILCSTYREVRAVTVQLRDYQLSAVEECYRSWDAHQNILLVEPTGAGKTVIATEIIRRWSGPVAAIAHRTHLVCQISLAFAKAGIRHGIENDDLVPLCINLHRKKFGKDYYDLSSRVTVGGVHTFQARRERLAAWGRSKTLWFMDEGHHILRKNVWGKVLSLFPNARGLAATATACRADGYGLGRHADGVIDYMIQGPQPAELMRRGHLTRYRYFSHDSHINLSVVPITASGEYSEKPLVREVRKSKIIGDSVDQYLKHVPGKLAITFVTDLKTCSEMTDAFNARGIPSQFVHAGTEDRLREKWLADLARGDLKNLLNVDIFGEGTDVPIIEAVIMARPSASFSLVRQQTGRVLRPHPGKEYGIILDQVGNWVRHGLPDKPMHYTLDRRERRAADEATKRTEKTCPSCTGVYEVFLVACPYCGFVPIPRARSTPEQVDGDLTEMSPELLAQLGADIAAIDRPVEEYRAELQAKHCPQLGVMAHSKRFLANQEAQANLRDIIAWWAGVQEALGRSHRESYRKFYHEFGLDVLSAKALPAAEAEALAGRICVDIGKTPLTDEIVAGYA